MPRCEYREWARGEGLSAGSDRKCGPTSQRCQVWSRATRPFAKAEGAALLATLMAMTLMTVLANALLLATMTEAVIASAYRDGVVARYLVEGATERAIGAARGEADWRLVAARSTQWAFADGGGRATVRATGAALDSDVETLELTAQASGPGGAVRTLVVVIARNIPAVSGRIRVVSWTENP